MAPIRWVVASVTYIVVGSITGMIIDERSGSGAGSDSVPVEIIMLGAGLFGAWLALIFYPNGPLLKRKSVSWRDEITGLRNKGALLERMEGQRDPACLVVFQIRMRRPSRDTEPAEDTDTTPLLQRHVAVIMTDELRRGDVLAHLGALNFAIWMPCTRPSVASLIAEWIANRLRISTLRHGQRDFQMSAVYHLAQVKEHPKKVLHAAEQAVARINNGYQAQGAPPPLQDWSESALKGGDGSTA